MKTGPEKTKVGGFGGFGFGIKPSASASKLPPARRPAPPKSATAGVSALFADSLDEDNKAAKGGLSSVPSWSKPTAEAVKAQRDADKLQAQDPTVFQYDEVLDDIKADLDQAMASQEVRTNALEQKKRTGLTVMKGSEAVRTGEKRESKYAAKVMIAVDRRRVEQQVVEDKLLQKEKDARQDAEVFVTGAFKEELKKRKKFEEELEQQDFKDSLKAAEKMEQGRGFADMYRNLLNGGLATSRGGEKVREQAPARIELEKTEEAEKEEKKEDDVKEEKVEVKEEVEQAAPGVVDAQAEPETDDAKAAKRAKIEEEKVERETKTMSAKERFLARKKAAAAGGGE